jgi:hypothetical protein
MVADVIEAMRDGAGWDYVPITIQVVSLGHRSIRLQCPLSRCRLSGRGQGSIGLPVLTQCQASAIFRPAKRLMQSASC